MKHMIHTTLVTAGLLLSASSAWAQFVPNMDAAAVNAEVQKQLAANTPEEAIIKAASDANVSPNWVIEALTTLVPKDKLQSTVAALAKQFSSNQPALRFLATSAQAQGLSTQQVRDIIVAHSPVANNALAGLSGITPSSPSGLSVNSIFNSNSALFGSGSGAPASAN